MLETKLLSPGRRAKGSKITFAFDLYLPAKKRFTIGQHTIRQTMVFFPEFKAGVHTGTVTTVEIGEVKRDIAYHGDTLNTAARIQGICNEHGKSLIASKILLDKLGTHPKMKLQELGRVLLKGKTTAIALASVEWSE